MTCLAQYIGMNAIAVFAGYVLAVILPTMLR
jgi:hypothetical protein